MEIGNVVSLKSDLSVYMMIEDFLINNDVTYVKCVWLNDNHDIQRDIFDKRLITILDNNY